MVAPQYTPQNVKYFSALAKQAADRKKWISAANGPALHVPNAAEAGFQQQRQAANEQYRTSLAGNAYQRSGVAQDYATRFRDLTQQFSKQREYMPYQFNQRGLLGGGLWRQGLQDYGQANLRAQGDLRMQQSQQLGSFDLVRQQIEAQRAQALAAIEAQRQALIGQIGPGTIQ